MNKIKIQILLLLVSIAILSASGSVKFQPLNGKISSKVQTDGRLKVLAVMVDFMIDTLKTTTGNGKFNSGYVYPDSLKIDATDHDSSYFFRKLKFVSNYFKTVSAGKAEFATITVLPQIVTLNEQICYFNYNNDNSELLSRKLVELHKRVWAKARMQLSEAELSSYDTFVIFHAGSGQEFSLENDETPFDIPSVYLNQAELKKYGSDDPVINNSIILPECEWQVSDVGSNPKWHFAGLNGAMVLMFAHHLGLPNLYSSKDNKSGVGRFDLMDQGSGNFSGMIPAGPSAWCREFMGWSDVKNLDDFQGPDSIIIKANSDIYRLDLDQNEYLLLEYRKAHNIWKDASSAYGYDKDGNKVARFYLKNFREKIEVLPGMANAVITHIDNYDYALPASGIFIWHVDKRKTTPELVKNNKVNEDYNNRGVYLEEADGSFDIGQKYWLLDAGYGTELGWTYDAFFDTNMVWRNYSNKKLFAENRTISFEPGSFPAADNNAGIPANISIYGFSGLTTRDSMYFRFKRTGFTPEFAVKNFGSEFKHLYHSQDNSSYLAVHDADSIRIMKLGDAGKVVRRTAFSAGGKPVLFPHAYGDLFYFFSDSAACRTYNLADNAVVDIVLPGKIRLQPVANTVLTDSGLYSFANHYLNKRIKNASGYALSQTAAGVPDFLAYLKNDTLYAGRLDTQMQIVAQNKIKLPFTTPAELKIVTDADGFASRIIVRKDNAVVMTGLDLKKIESVSVTGLLLNFCDADRDGKLEFLVADNGQTLLKNQFGTLENGFGININSSAVASSSLLAYEEDGQTAFIAADTTGIINAFTADSKINNSLKQVLPVGKSINSAYDLVEMDNQVYLSLARTDSGYIQYYLLGDGNLKAQNLLPGANWSSSRGNLIGLYAEKVITDAKIFKNGSVYNWPNPAKENITNFRFFLNEPAAVKITVYDLAGKKVADLVENYSQSGDYFELKWNLDGISSGIYLASVKVSAGGKSESYKVKVSVAK